MADAPVSSLAPAAPAAPAALTSHPQLAKALAFAKALEPQKTLETTTTPLLAGALPDDDEVYGALDDDVPPVSVVLRDVTCTRRNGAATLRRVSCAFHPGAATAILWGAGRGARGRARAGHGPVRVLTKICIVRVYWFAAGAGLR